MTMKGMTMTHLDLSTILRTYDALNYRFHTEKPYFINIGAVRTADLTSGKFNDIFFMFHRVDSTWNFYSGECTTDPGLYYRDYPITPDGTAIMLPGQHEDAYIIGKHKGRYTALRQNKPIPFARVHPNVWNNQDVIDTIYGIIAPDDVTGRIDVDGFEVQTRVIGANIHRALEYETIVDVGKFSAACIVQPDPDQHRRMIALAHRQVESGHGQDFDFTLIAENQLVE
jgi:hypothetical protein